MPDVQITTSTTRTTNEYNGRKVVLRDSYNNQMSIPRFFQLALVSANGIGVNPTQGYEGGHNAWDMASNGYIGIVPARCPVFGTVYFTQQNHPEAGNWVIVQENNPSFDRWHIFMHLDSIAVSEGDPIKQGDSVGMIGDTGRSSGPHLHYQVALERPRDTDRVSEDPMVTFDRGTLNPSWKMEGAVAAHNWDYIQLDTAAQNYGPPGGSTNIKALNIQLRINPPPKIIFNLRYPVISNTDTLDNIRPVIPGYFKPSELYEAHNAHLYQESYEMRDTTRTDILISWNYSRQISKKPVLLFTTDGRDPLKYGRTIYLKDEGGIEVNDYESSANIFPILCEFALPINIRAALIDADSHDVILTQASAVFTRESTAYVPEQYSHLRRYYQALLTDAPARRKSMYSEDKQGYITLNETYDTQEYTDLIPGLEDGDN